MPGCTTRSSLRLIRVSAALLTLPAAGAIAIGSLATAGRAQAARADTGSCSGASLSFDPATAQPAVGGGGAPLPALHASCNGSAVTASGVQLALSGVPAIFSSSGSRTASASSSALPAVVGGDSGGAIAVTASWSGVTTVLNESVQGSEAGILSPSHPAKNLSSSGKGDLAAINAAHASEGLQPMVLPDNWPSLDTPSKLFVAMNLERIARGLPTLSGLTPELNNAAADGAANNSDPNVTLPEGAASGSGIWSGGATSPLWAIYDWMYADGPGPGGLDAECGSDHTTCWGHRDSILFHGTDQGCFSPCVAGSGGRTRSYAAVLVSGVAGSTPALTFTWSSELSHLPPSERSSSATPPRPVSMSYTRTTLPAGSPDKVIVRGLRAGRLVKVYGRSGNGARRLVAAARANASGVAGASFTTFGRSTFTATVVTADNAGRAVSKSKQLHLT